MDFEEWWDEVGHNLWCDNDDIFLSDLVKAAWDYQQKIIDDFKQANNDLAKAAIRPDGYVLVPVEPTEKMIEAGYNAYVNSGWIRTYEIYEAMIQAAQEEE